MTTVFDRIRLTVGLAHAASGATLVVDTPEGQRLNVHRGPDADVDLCTMRRSVIGSARLGRPDQAWADTELRIGGLLEAYRADIHRRRFGPIEHWFATLLHPGHVFDRLESLDIDPELSVFVEVTLKPDPGLGVTLVAVRATAAGTEAHVSEATEIAYAACVADELDYVSQHQIVGGPEPMAPDTDERR